MRELENAIERAAIMTSDDLVLPAALPAAFRARVSRSRLRVASSATFSEARTHFERSYLQQALDEAHGNVSQAARRAGMDRSNFRRLLERHGVRDAETALTRDSARVPAAG